MRYKKGASTRPAAATFTTQSETNVPRRASVPFTYYQIHWLFGHFRRVELPYCHTDCLTGKPGTGIGGNRLDWHVRRLRDTDGQLERRPTTTVQNPRDFTRMTRHLARELRMGPSRAVEKRPERGVRTQAAIRFTRWHRLNYPRARLLPYCHDSQELFENILRGCAT